MFLDPVTLMLGMMSGALTGLILGVVGGGGSILAVPLLVYVVGVSSPHIAIGTSALAVAVSALTNLASKAKSGLIKWRCGAVFALSGMIGAFGGANLAKLVDGQKLLGLFGILMIIIGVAMMSPRDRGRARCETHPRKCSASCPSSGRNRLHRRYSVRIFRHWGRISHRSRPDARHRNADHVCNRHLACRRLGLRRNNLDHLCPVGVD